MSLHTKNRIMKCSIDIITKKGFDATRTKEIATKAGVSEATIFKYFKSKKDLLKLILIDMLNDFTIQSKEIIGKTIQSFKVQKNLNYITMLEQVINERLLFFQQKRALITIIIREMLIDSTLKDLFLETIHKNLSNLLDVIIRKGIHNGELSKETSVSTLKDTIIGIIIYNTVIQPSFSINNKIEIHNITDIIIKSVTA